MPLPPDTLLPLLRLAIVPGIGPGRLTALLARFGSPEGALGASGPDVGTIPGFGPELVRRVMEAGSPTGLARARAALDALRKAGAVTLTPDDAEYPAAFRQLPDPPFVLFAAGNLELLGAPGIAVVGTRTPSDYGRRAAMMLSDDLARAGYAIVSGMAKGIDAAAHAAALEAGGTTVGVLGHGIDLTYPPENRNLFARVRERGVLISELPPGEPPVPGNFPRRNRLIAALSLGVLVVEMGEKSGALHTVTYALELGKEVFSVPGPIGSPTSAGTNQLLKEGARLVTSAQDILEELHGVGVSAPTPLARPRSLSDLDADFGEPAAGPGAPAAVAEAPADLAPDEAEVLAVLGRDEPQHVDELTAKTGLAPSRVLAALLGLELRELTESRPGKLYVRR